jgi:hypothetical protein
MEGDITQTRAADDFAVIRARMEELRREHARPRAADDFAAIRARMEELRRERAQVSAEAARCAISGARRDAIATVRGCSRAQPSKNSSSRRASAVVEFNAPDAVLRLAPRTMTNRMSVVAQQTYATPARDRRPSEAQSAGGSRQQG